MRYTALATDFDGTLAHDGLVEESTWTELQRWLSTGHKLILVTGREMADLFAICPHLDLFERVVAENGALVYRPATKETKLLAEPPSEKFVELLRQRGVVPLSVGRVIVATMQPHEHAVLQTVQELGLELQITFNKGSVMVLPPSVNKATGLMVALEEMGLSPKAIVGVGDAENDHAFLSVCGLAVAVANALPALKEKADFVTLGRNGVGVQELVQKLLAEETPQ